MLLNRKASVEVDLHAQRYIELSYEALYASKGLNVQT